MGVSRRIDLTGQRFGHVVVLREFAINKHRETMWLCRCDCGTEFVKRGWQLRSGNVQDCGCATWDLAPKKKKRKPIVDSICWDCIRSAAPPALQCSWDKRLELPEGAEVVVKKTVYGDTLMVTKCPLFLSLKAQEYREMLAAEREKVATNYEKRVINERKH